MEEAEPVRSMAAVAVAARRHRAAAEEVEIVSHLAAAVAVGVAHHLAAAAAAAQHFAPCQAVAVAGKDQPRR